MKKFLISIIGLFLLTVIAITFINRDIPLEELKDRYTYNDSKFIDIDGLQVHYRDSGTGPYILLVHGTSSSLHTWDGWTETLSNDYRVISLDLPGFGLTGPYHNGDYTITRWVDFINSFTDGLGMEKFTIAGNSLGGFISARFTTAYPEKVSTLILLDASGLPSYEDNDPPLAFKLANNSVLKYVVRYFTPKSLVEKSVKQVFGDPSLVTPDLVDRYHNLAKRAGNRDAMIKMFSTRRESDTTKLLGISAPTLIMWGDQDHLIPLSHGYRWEQIIQNSELKIYENVGHIPMEEIPGQSVNDAIEFLSRN